MSENPKELKDALRICAEHYRDIKAMWLKLMVKDESENSWLLVVQHSGERKILFDALEETARHAGDHLPVDIVSLSDPIGKKSAEGNPFYQRKSGLFGIF